MYKRYFITLCFLILNICTNTNAQITNKVFTSSELYPIADPYEGGYIQVSDIHTIYYEQFGNPDGVPVLVLHGGPGAGCCKQTTALFDTSYYRVVMVDQRGAMRSIPFADMRENRSDLLVEDMEVIREHLHIDKWLLFGGSWGSALALLYGETYPDRVLGFVLRGIFLARKKDYEHLFWGMKSFFPEAWHAMVQSFSYEEKANLITTMHNKIMDEDPLIHMPLARSFIYYDTLGGIFKANPDKIKQLDLDPVHALSVARPFIHYSANNFFLRDNQLLEDISKIKHLPLTIIQGRYDIICPPETAYDLYTCWDDAQLWFIPDGGHFALDPSIACGLKEALDVMKEKY